MSDAGREAEYRANHTPVVTARKLTGVEQLRWACSATIHGKESKADLTSMYRAEHSPARTQVFEVEMTDIPTFVSVHFVRHSIGVVHFAATNREDLPYRASDEVHRWTPVRHHMHINAQALINMSRERLCYKAHSYTVSVMSRIAKAVAKADPDLGPFMRMECEYRFGVCTEPTLCDTPPRGVVLETELDSTTERLIRWLRTRSAQGQKKYGVGLSRDDLSLKEWLVHAMEEQGDNLGYLMRAWQEVEKGARDD